MDPETWSLQQKKQPGQKKQSEQKSNPDKKKQLTWTPQAGVVSLNCSWYIIFLNSIYFLLAETIIQDRIYEPPQFDDDKNMVNTLISAARPTLSSRRTARFRRLTSLLSTVVAKSWQSPRILLFRYFTTTTYENVIFARPFLQISSNLVNRNQFANLVFCFVFRPNNSCLFRPQ